jgi:hypothetical protein
MRKWEFEKEAQRHGCEKGIMDGASENRELLWSSVV